MSGLSGGIEAGRYELIALAAQRERATRSRGPLILAGIAIVGTLIVLGVGLIAQQRAAAKLATETRRAERIIQLSENLRQLSMRSTSETDSLVGDPITNLYSRVQELARQAQLERDVRLPAESQIGQGAGVRRMAYRYTTNDPSLENLMSWIEAVTIEIPQMHVRSIKLTPLASGWSLDVTFSRWERTSPRESS